MTVQKMTADFIFKNFLKKVTDVRFMPNCSAFFCTAPRQIGAPRYLTALQDLFNSIWCPTLTYKDKETFNGAPPRQ
jgi:hypothetical protein